MENDLVNFYWKKNGHIFVDPKCDPRIQSGADYYSETKELHFMTSKLVNICAELIKDKEIKDEWKETLDFFCFNDIDFLKNSLIENDVKNE